MQFLWSKEKEFIGIEYETLAKFTFETQIAFDVGRTKYSNSAIKLTVWTFCIIKEKVSCLIIRKMW